MPGQPGRDQPWQDELLGPQDASWDDLITPAHDSRDVCNGLMEGMGLRPARRDREPLPGVSDLREQMGL